MKIDQEKLYLAQMFNQVGANEPDKSVEKKNSYFHSDLHMIFFQVER